MPSIIRLELELPLSSGDKELLLAIAGGAPGVTAALAEPAAEPEKPKRTRTPKPEADAAPPADPADEDLVGGTGPTMADAVALATELVSTGKATKVKAALTDLGAARVSELKEKDIPTFMAALQS